MVRFGCEVLGGEFLVVRLGGEVWVPTVGGEFWVVSFQKWVVSDTIPRAPGGALHANSLFIL